MGVGSAAANFMVGNEFTIWEIGNGRRQRREECRPVKALEGWWKVGRPISIAQFRGGTQRGSGRSNDRPCTAASPMVDKHKTSPSNKGPGRLRTRAAQYCPIFADAEIPLDLLLSLL